MVTHTRAPENPDHTPRILAFYSPVRGGTTAFCIMMTSHPQVKRSYFQPHKNTLRWGKDFVIDNAQPNEVIVVKDTFGPTAPEEFFDPIELMRRAGIPDEKLTVILSIRNPVTSAQSANHFLEETLDPLYWTQVQKHTIDLFHNYRTELGRQVIPFSFDLLAEYPADFVVRRLIKHTGLGLQNGLTRQFDESTLTREAGKMIWGEAEDSSYYNKFIAPVIKHGELRYVQEKTNYPPLAPAIEQTIRENCISSYLAFHQLARKALLLEHI